MDFQIEVIGNPSKVDIDLFNKFSDDNWDSHVDSETDIKNNFFATPDIIVQAKNNNEIVGGLFVFIRTINFDNKKVRIAGIGNVATSIKERHKGIAREVLAKSVDILKRENIDIAMLCTDIKKLGGLYSKVGFTELGRPYYFLNKNGVEEAESGGMIAFINSKEIFDMIKESDEKLFVGASNF